MKKIKVLTVIGTRPEIIRLSRVIPKLDEFTSHTLVHTGQNYDYELNEIFFKDLELRAPDYFLKASDKNASKTISKILYKFDETLEKVSPDAVVVLGDTNSSLSVLAAKKRKIPIFHLEAGNRCFDFRVPEEINRKIVDHISDMNLTYSAIAREYLLNEGFAPDRVINVGSPMKEVLNFYKDKIFSSQILEKLKLKEGQFFLVSSHREENIDPDINFKSFINLLNNLSKKYKKRIIVSTHPRTKKRIKNSDAKVEENISFLKPLSFSEYVKLQISAKAVLSDSGTISEESSILNFPALNIRESHERPEAMEESSLIMNGLNSEFIFNSLKTLELQKKKKIKFNVVNDYSSDNVSDKVLRIVLSYTDYVNRKVWNK